MTEAAPLLEARNLWKAFFDNPVLKGVSIEVRPGRVHALLGENGAGKSTLINVLSGVLQPDQGTISFAGRNPGALRPAQARALGIAVVQQELSLAPHLSVAENIALGAMPTRGGFIDFATLAGKRQPSAGSSVWMYRSICRLRRCRSAAGSWSRSPRRCGARQRY